MESELTIEGYMLAMAALLAGVPAGFILGYAFALNGVSEENVAEDDRS